MKAIEFLKENYPMGYAQFKKQGDLEQVCGLMEQYANSQTVMVKMKIGGVKEFRIPIGMSHPEMVDWIDTKVGGNDKWESYIDQMSILTTGGISQ